MPNLHIYKDESYKKSEASFNMYARVKYFISHSSRNKKGKKWKPDFNSVK